MIGWIFLAIFSGGAFWAIATNYQGIAATLGGLLGFSIEPFTGTSLFTDWITFCLYDWFGMFLISGIGIFWCVIVLNGAGVIGNRSGDVYQ